MPAGRLRQIAGGGAAAGRIRRRGPPKLTKFKYAVTRRRKHGMNALMTKYNNINPFPQRMIVKQGYSERKVLTAGVATIFGTEQVYNLNNLFDPDFTGVGHQPYGRDTLATIYSKYKVTGVKISVTWYNPSADGVLVGMMISPPSQATTLTGSNYDTAGERPNTQIKSISDTGEQKTWQGGYFPMHKLAQVSKLQFNANVENFAAVAGSGPAAGYQPHVRLAIAGPAGAETCEYKIELTYYATWYDRIILATS